MKVFDVKISVINPDYNAKYEKEYGWLERKYENPKFKSEIAWQIKNLTEYKYRESTEYELQYVINDEKHNCLLKDVCVLELLNNAEIIADFIVSKSLISGTRVINKKKYDKGYFYFYLKPNVDYAKLNDGIYISIAEIPEELKMENK